MRIVRSDAKTKCDVRTALLDGPDEGKSTSSFENAGDGSTLA